MAGVNIEKLLQSVEIDRIAERLGMELRNQSSTIKTTLCPFHDDKSPSLQIDTSRSHGRQHYHCYACGAHGDVIDLVKGSLQVDFKQAVDWLDPDAYKSLSRTTDKTRSAASTKDNTSGLDQGLKLYQSCNDLERLKSWAKSRNYPVEVLKDAGFTYAPKLAISKTLSTMPFSTSREIIGKLEDAHLIRKIVPDIGSSSFHLALSDDPKYTDFFVGDRIVFPIRDQQKKVVGIVGRATSDQGAKYLFSKNFQKSKVFYRADRAFAKIKALAKQHESEIRLYICEGFLDTLRLESLGLAAVGAMGSSISKEQIDLIKTLNDSLPKQSSLKICVCFDRDEAGLGKL